MKKILIIIADLIILCNYSALSQNTKIDWFESNGTFHASNNGSTLMKSMVGQPLAWRNANNTTLIESGFLANRQVKNIVISGVENNEYEFSNLNSQFSIKVSPNPFDDITEIRFSLAKAASVSLEIYNQYGEKIIEFERTMLAIGTHTYEWNGSDQYEMPVPSGLYSYGLNIEINGINLLIPGKIIILR